MSVYDRTEPAEPSTDADLALIPPPAQPQVQPELQPELQPEVQSEFRSTEPPESSDEQPGEDRQPGESAQGAYGNGSRRNSEPENLEPVFESQHAKEIHLRWHDIQAGFVDDPHEAIQRAGALNDEVVSSLTGALEDRKRTLEQGIADGDTEQLRIGLRQYRSMLDQILTL